MSKSVYITGIAGFIGSTLAKKLHSEGYEVSGIDNLSFSDGSNLEGTDIVWEVGDFDNVDNIRADTIIHLAAITCARYDNVTEMFEVNYRKSESLVQKFQNKRIIFASTCLTDLPYTNAYAESKYEAELYFTVAHDNNMILRFANVYGDNQRDWGPEPNVLASWKKAVREGKPIRIDGTGKQTRDFIHVDDVCQAITNTIERTDIYGLTIPICTGTQYSINELAEIVHPDVEKYYGPKNELDYDYIDQSPKMAAAVLNFVAKRKVEDYNG